MTAGRPPFKEIPMGIWVLVEVMRDRKEPGRPRGTVRFACKRLEKKLAKDIKGPRHPKWETFRHHYKKFETMRRSNSGEELTRATELLAIARRRRDFLGWDTSPWLFVMEPESLAAKGVEVILKGRGVEVIIQG